jgi:threonine dehydratase
MGTGHAGPAQEEKNDVITLDDVYTARARIQPYLRRTPLLRTVTHKDKPFDGDLILKLEYLQVTGAFKPRGAINKLLSLPPDAMERGLVTASGGNHGLAVAYAGWVTRKPVMVFLPHTTPPTKAEKLRQWGAEVIFEGMVWDEANIRALEVAEREGRAYIHPFGDPLVIAGQGTIGLEILDDFPQVDTILVAIGGGGLISGVSLAVKTLKPSVRVIGVEPLGAPTLKQSVAAGHLVELAEVTTRVSTLAARRSTQINLDIIRQYVDDIVLVTDEEMIEAARWLWFETGIAAEMSGAAAMAALLLGRVQTAPSENICAVVCGAGSDGIE